MVDHGRIRERMAQLRQRKHEHASAESDILDYLEYALMAVETLETQIREDTALLNAVEQLCTAEKSFSYWASVAFGVKPRDVLRKILHEAQRQASEQQHAKSRQPSGERTPSEGEGSDSGGERVLRHGGAETGPAPHHERGSEREHLQP